LRTWFQKLTDLTAIATTEKTLKEALPELVEELGFERYAYLNLQPVRTFAVSNYPIEWQMRYLAEAYATVDPVISTARAEMKAFIWTVERPRRVTSKRLRRFYIEAHDFGIRSGISIPVRTAFGHMSMLTLASSRASFSLERDIDQVAAVTAVAQLHARLEQQHAHPTASAQIDLKAKQAVCLRWSAEGKSMRAIATIENMSFGTVNFHLNNARKALDASSLAQATALATKLKLI